MGTDMPLTREELNHLTDAYQVLCRESTLSEHRVELNSLTEEEQICLAVQILNACPDDQLAELASTITALQSDLVTENTFHVILSQAYELKISLENLLNPENLSPYLIFIKPRFDIDLFLKFRSLIDQELNTDRTAVTIATRLARRTPIEHHLELLENIGNLPLALFPVKVAYAFELCRNIDRVEDWIQDDGNIHQAREIDELLEFSELLKSILTPECFKRLLAMKERPSSLTRDRMFASSDSGISSDAEVDYNGGRSASETIDYDNGFPCWLV